MFLQAIVRSHTLHAGATGGRLSDADAPERTCISCRKPIAGVLARLGAVQCEDCRTPRRVTHPF